MATVDSVVVRSDVWREGEESCCCRRSRRRFGRSLFFNVER